MILTVLAVLSLLVYTLKDVNFYEVYLLLKKVNLFYFSLAVASCLFGFLLWNLRWKNTLMGLIDADYWFLLHVLFAGVFFNNITPGTGLGGEPVRAHFLSKKYKKPKTKIFGSILAEKVFNESVFFIFVVISILFLLIFVHIPNELKIIFWSFVIIFLILAIIFLIISKKKELNLRWLLKKLFKIKSIKKNFRSFKRFEKYVHKKILNFKSAFKSSVLGKNKLYRGLLFSAGIWMLTYFVSYFLFLSLGVKVNFLTVVVAVTLSWLVGDLSPIPGGVGLLESTMFLLYSSMGISAPFAVVVTLLSRIIYYFFAFFIGGLSSIYLKFKIK